MPGLGVLPGRCVSWFRVRSAFAKASADNWAGAPAQLKVPHVGLECAEADRAAIATARRCGRRGAGLLHALVRGPDGDATVGLTEHGVPFASVVERGLVFGVQFHPEKSSETGLRMLRNFIASPLSQARRAGPTGSATPDPDSRFPTGHHADALQANHRVPRRARRAGRQGREVRGAAQRRRPGRARASATTSRASTKSSSSTSPRRSRRAARWPRRSRAVASDLFIPLAVGGGIAIRGRRGRGRRRRRGQGQPEQRGAEDPASSRARRRYGSQAVVVAIDAKRERRALRGVRPQRHDADAGATRSSGRAKRPTAAPARSC